MSAVSIEVAQMNTADRLTVAIQRIEAIEFLAKRIAGAEVNYRNAYEQFGDSDIRTGRAWDALRKAGNAVRDHFSKIED